MRPPFRLTLPTALVALLLPLGAAAQTFATDDPVLERIWEEGMDNSHVYHLGQALMDSVGPRLTGSPGLDAAHDWVVGTYRGWGIDAENEQYGTWTRWDHGLSHLDLLEPRRRSLTTRPLAWTGGTAGPVEGPVLTLPDVTSANEFRSWLQEEVPGSIVLLTFPQPTCRPDEYWEELGTDESVQAMREDREARRENWNRRLGAAGVNPNQISLLLEEAGALGILTSNWTGSWGTNRIFSGNTRSIPMLDVECEDYGMLARLAENGQGPRASLNVEADFMGETPTYNSVARIQGASRPDEYILLSAHLDTWHGATGATDNGTGTIVMMEAMRILKEVFPEPSRTIVAGHWGGEEQGLNGSAAFAEDHPEILEGMQLVMNQDNGTGRITEIGMQGFTGAAPFFARWLSAVPAEISRFIDLEVPGLPDIGRSDHASFVCHQVPSFRLGSHEWDYREYTWHSNRDSFDKIALQEVRWNAILTAMLAYLASEEPDLIPRDTRVMPVDDRTGEHLDWPTCRTPMRTAPPGF
jgi:carboxypeptidase Q